MFQLLTWHIKTDSVRRVLDTIWGWRKCKYGKRYLTNSWNTHIRVRTVMVVVVVVFMTTTTNSSIVGGNGTRSTKLWITISVYDNWRCRMKFQWYHYCYWCSTTTFPIINLCCYLEEVITGVYGNGFGVCVVLTFSGLTSWTAWEFSIYTRAPSRFKVEKIHVL